MFRNNLAQASCLWAFLLLIFTGCVDIARFTTPLPPSSQSEAASTHVGAVAVARWSDYVAALQPAFKLDEEQALQKAIPLTASFQSRLVEAVRLGLQAGLPISTETITQRRTVDAAGQAAETEERQRTSGPGTLPTPQAPIGSIPAAGNLQLPTIPTGEDPFLQYSVATDLLQEVRILNRALADARVRQNAEPYFLRLKVAVIPFRRGLEYDAYSDISFFSRNEGSTIGDGTSLPSVVPLLVTDNLEAAGDAAAAEVVAEFAASLNAPVSNVAAAAQLQALSDRLTAGAANDRNALRTVARLGENALRVRFGAILQTDERGKKAYELIPRTHTISLLVLSPRTGSNNEPARSLNLVTRTVLKNARNGDQLPLGRSRPFNNELNYITDSFNVPKRLMQNGQKCGIEADQNAFDWVNDLRARYVAVADYASFRRIADCVFGKVAEAEAEAEADAEGLWTALVSFTGDYAVTGQLVDLPKPPISTLPPAEIVAIVNDDKDARTVVRFNGGRGLADTEVTVMAVWDNKNKRLPADKVMPDQAGITAIFPSLERIGLVDKGSPIPGLTIEAAIPGNASPLVVDRDHLLYQTKANDTAQDASLSFQIQATRLIVDKGEGKLVVGVQLEPGRPPRRAFIRVSGAEIIDASTGTRDVLGRLVLAGSARVQLGLRNLAAGGQTSVIVGVLDEKGKEVSSQTSVLDVVAVPSRAKN